MDRLKNYSKTQVEDMQYTSRPYIQTLAQWQVKLSAFSESYIAHFFHWYHLKSHMQSHEKEAFIPLLCLPTYLYLRMRPKVHHF